MTRREIREEIFRLLFRIEFYSEEELEEQLQFTADEGEASEADAAYIQNKIRDLAGRVTEIDDMINAVARGWKTGRMGKVDLTLIRLAVYEIKFEEDIPTGVAINEAVELAKRYGNDDDFSFVNGVLGAYVREEGKESPELTPGQQDAGQVLSDAAEAVVSGVEE